MLMPHRQLSPAKGRRTGESLGPNSQGLLPRKLAHPDCSSRVKFREAPNTRDGESNVPEHHALFVFLQSCPEGPSFLLDDLTSSMGHWVVIAPELTRCKSSSRDRWLVFSACTYLYDIQTWPQCAQVIRLPVSRCGDLTDLSTEGKTMITA